MSVSLDKTYDAHILVNGRIAVSSYGMPWEEVESTFLYCEWCHNGSLKVHGTSPCHMEKMVVDLVRYSAAGVDVLAADENGNIVSVTTDIVRVVPASR